jgi:hypothetical protein
MGGHFDAVGFGDPERGFEATREHLRTAVQRGRRVAETDEVVYYALESAEGCGLVAATDRAGFLLNGCPYFRGELRQSVAIEALQVWDEAAPDQGGARGLLAGRSGAEGTEVTFALPRYAAEAAAEPSGTRALNLVGLGYRAAVQADEHDRFLRPLSWDASLPPLRRCNLECRGRVERSHLLVNSLTGARLAYALLDCGPTRLEVVLDVPSLEGGLVEGAQLEGSFWLVARSLDS